MTAPEKTATEPTVIASRRGRVGHILLNRPRALNAIDLPMVAAVHAALDDWRDDPHVHAVVIEGAGGRAFCAGGDIRWVRDRSLAGDHASVEAFFVAEYALNLAIAHYPKPYIALIDGVCMGGGIGLSVHGTMRVVTDAAMLAMPETGIGLFPDIGASFFLPRLRAEYGMYLALTGARVHGADAVHLGLATHYVSRDRLATLADGIAEHGIAALADTAEVPPPGTMLQLADTVRCFGGASVDRILADLEAAGAHETLAVLRAMSPSSVLWSFELLRRGADRTLEQCQAAELALTRHTTRHPDFIEGVRAMVVDKDRTPRWTPARIEDVDPAAIGALFA
ncbi:MAG: enoyl-CoA hydratase/isomerase family protein [Gemmatimonadaceae bacterium]|nr:enoyl-CoA hydratase/isomerase family protein [Acetobacteraceae bacterium]